MQIRIRISVIKEFTTKTVYSIRKTYFELQNMFFFFFKRGVASHRNVVVWSYVHFTIFFHRVVPKLCYRVDKESELLRVSHIYVFFFF